MSPYCENRINLAETGHPSGLRSGFYFGKLSTFEIDENHSLSPLKDEREGSTAVLKVEILLK